MDMEIIDEKHKKKFYCIRFFYKRIGKKSIKMNGFFLLFLLYFLKSDLKIYTNYT